MSKRAHAEVKFEFDVDAGGFLLSESRDDFRSEKDYIAWVKSELIDDAIRTAAYLFERESVETISNNVKITVSNVRIEEA